MLFFSKEVFGVCSSISQPLELANIDEYYISSFHTGYCFIPSEKLELAKELFAKVQAKFVSSSRFSISDILDDEKCIDSSKETGEKIDPFSDSDSFHQNSSDIKKNALEHHTNGINGTKTLDDLSESHNHKASSSKRDNEETVKKSPNSYAQVASFENVFENF